MSILLTALTMIAFAAVYAVLLAMLGARAGDLAAALLGRRVRVPALRFQAGGAMLAASRRCNRA